MNITSNPTLLVAQQDRLAYGKGQAFNFKSLTASPPKPRSDTNANTGSPAVKLERRRGHHHKHSLSHQFFLPPVERSALPLPDSFPIPSWREVLASSNGDQRTQLLWALLHLMTSFAVLKVNDASLAILSLSKCISFDAYGVASVAVFEILDNFPVWRSSSIKYSFGLKRAEVVVRFGAAVFLTYSGVELIREVVEHLIIGGGHGHGSSDAVHLDAHSLGGEYLSISMIVTIAITCFAAFVFDNHSQLSEALDLQDLPRGFRNPFYYITILPAILLLVISLSGMHLHAAVDHAIAAVIAFSFISIGTVLIFRLGSILLMTYPSKSIDELYETISADDSVTNVELEIWQVWSGLVMVGLKLRVRGDERTESRLKERVNRYVRDILAGGYGSGRSVKFDVHIECERI